MCKIKLLVCCHKQDYYRSKEDHFFPIHVGKVNSHLDLKIQGDNIGINISEKNPSYCELTGLYWAWKNLVEVDYIGLCHYRRYFDFHDQSELLSDSLYVKGNEVDLLNFNLPDIKHIFSKYDVILAKPRIYPYNLSIDYSITHYKKDLNVLESIIENLTPEYSSAFRNVFYLNNKLSHYNMFIMKKEYFDKYCHWLFTILLEAEKMIDISNYDLEQKRIFGYFGERLLLVWTTKHNLRKKYYPIIHVNDSVAYNSTLIHKIQRIIRKNIAFQIMKER